MNAPLQAVLPAQSDMSADVLPAAAPALAEAAAAPAATREPRPGLGRVFHTLWLGQFISAFGTAMTSFALGVWLFQRTASVGDFTSMLLFGSLPALIVTPWAGSLADRFDKRVLLMACEVTSLVSVGTIGWLVWTDAFQLWHLFAAQTLLSLSMAFQAPAAYAAISSIVDKKQFGRVGGMFSLARAVSQLAAPMIAATLLALIGLPGIILIDVVSFWCALSALMMIRFPAIPPRLSEDESRAAAVFQRPLKDFAHATRFLLERPAMAIIYGYVTLAGFLTGMVAVLVTPMVLASHSSESLALITTCGSIGVLLGGLAMIVTGGPKRWTRLLLLLNVAEGVAVACGGYTLSVAALCACSFVALMTSTMMAACVQSVWRRKVPRDRQGSISALQQAITLSMVPLAALLGGWFSQHVFEPALMPGGAWFDSVGAWFGSGKGRGIGFLFFVVGNAVALLSLLALGHRRMHAIEADVPDLV